MHHLMLPYFTLHQVSSAQYHLVFPLVMSSHSASCHIITPYFPSLCLSTSSLLLTLCHFVSFQGTLPHVVVTAHRPVSPHIATTLPETHPDVCLFAGQQDGLPGAAAGYVQQAGHPEAAAPPRLSDDGQRSRWAMAELSTCWWERFVDPPS